MAIIKLKTEEYKKTVQERLKKKLISVAHQIEGMAKARCPVDTGRLRASISVNWNGSGMSRGKVGKEADAGEGVGCPSATERWPIVVVIGTNVKYAEYIELGTKKMTARPYLRPAYDASKGKLAKL